LSRILEIADDYVAIPTPLIYAEILPSVYTYILSSGTDHYSLSSAGCNLCCILSISSALASLLLNQGGSFEKPHK